MALFTDGISTIQDLMNQDSSVLTTSQTENIDLSTKLTIALQELGIEVMTLLQPGNNCGWEIWLPPSPQLINIVVTPPLQLWHVFQSLMLVYQDAYYNQLNDRYQAKRDQFQGLAKWAMQKVIQSGLGIVSDPLPQAAAPQLTSIPGGQPATTYYASVSWLNTEGEEGQPGAAAALAVDAGNVLVVQPLSEPINAVSWNIYAGTSDTTLTLQNTAALALDQVWIQAAPVSLGGIPPGTGQAANYTRNLPRVMQRG
jgi:hypothetical protein